MHPASILSPNAEEIAECINENAHCALEDRLRAEKRTGRMVEIISPNTELAFAIIRIADEYGLPVSKMAKVSKDLIYMLRACRQASCAVEIIADLDFLIGSDSDD